LPQCSQAKLPPSTAAAETFGFVISGKAAGPDAGWGKKKPKGFGDGAKLVAMSRRRASAISSSSSKYVLNPVCSGGYAEGTSAVGGMAAGAFSLGMTF
jgi:hypothetical protein